MALGRRCDLGCESWPDSNAYSTCPACGEPTTRFNNLTPIPASEADSFVRHVKFEQFYEDRCIARGILPDGELPEGYGPLSDAALEALCASA